MVTFVSSLVTLTAALAVAAPPTTAGNRLLAHRDARSLLQRVVLPAGARRLGTAPGGIGGLLSVAQRIPGTAQLVNWHRLWRVHASLGDVFAFEVAHPPPGSRVDGYSSSRGPRYPPNHGLQFTFPAPQGRLSSREVEVELVALRGGWTGIRADAQAIWIVTRPRSEVVPAGAREIDIGSHHVTKPQQMAKIVSWFDALPIAQPGDVYCPLHPLR